MLRKSNSLLIPSAKEVLVLELLKGHGTTLFGLELVERSNGLLKRGTVYVTLQRMEEKGLLNSEQEPRPAPEIGIPRRRYRISGVGERALRAHQAATMAFLTDLVASQA